uniref:response regulator n=1 Tax=Sphingorhabdus sp. TaxID=1902408 RepID=UPI0035930E3C
MDSQPQQPHSSASALRDDIGARLPAAAYLRYQSRADGWGAGRQAAFLAHLADNGLVEDAARAVGMSVGGVQEDPYDFAILDLRLPDADGLDLMEELHQHQTNLPILIL